MITNPQKSHNSFRSNLIIIILITIIGFFSIKIFAYSGIEGCSGMPDGLGKVPVWIIGIVLLIIGIIRLFISKDSNRNRKLITLGLLIFSPLAIITQITFNIKINNSKVILTTSSKPKWNSQALNLELRKNGSYTISYYEIEWSCFHTGEYRLKNDTLTLLDQFNEHFSDITSQSYILREPFLIPIEEEKDTLIIAESNLPTY